MATTLARDLLLPSLYQPKSSKAWAVFFPPTPPSPFLTSLRGGGAGPRGREPVTVLGLCWEPGEPTAPLMPVIQGGDVGKRCAVGGQLPPSVHAIFLSSNVVPTSSLVTDSLAFSEQNSDISKSFLQGDL